MCAFRIVPTVFLPLRYLSFTSLIGILSTVVLIVVIIVDGSVKQHAPGSLHEPVPTNIGPDWRHLPLAFGLVMSGYSGHAVMPSLTRDMAHPEHFNAMIDSAYGITFVMYLLTAVCGYLMCGIISLMSRRLSAYENP